MKRAALFVFLSTPVLAQTPDNTASMSMQRRIQGLKLLSLPGIDGKAAPEPKPAAQVRLRMRIDRWTPCAIAMPNAIPDGGASYAMPIVVPPTSATEKGEIIVPRVSC